MAVLLAMLVRGARSPGDPGGAVPSEHAAVRYAQCLRLPAAISRASCVAAGTPRARESRSSLGTSQGPGEPGDRPSGSCVRRSRGTARPFPAPSGLGSRLGRVLGVVRD